MKIRCGFVSNSSASSFCIYGICIDQNNIIKAQELIDKGLLKEEDFKYESWKNDPYDYLGILGLRIANMDDEMGLYIGNEWSSIKDDETGLQFKKRTEDILKQIVKNPDNIKIVTLEEAWYNG